MFLPRCIRCFKLSGKINFARPVSYAFTSALEASLQQFSTNQQWQRFSTKSEIPLDVLKSRADEFSGAQCVTFESAEVQTLLKRMTTIDLGKIFAPRKEELANPTYKLMDDEELLKDEEEIIAEVEGRLKMPHVRDLRKPINVIISKDEELIQFDEEGADYIFTDISPSENIRTCAVLVRENSTGILREGSWDERDRMQFMYWPKEGQTYEIAPMLLDENLPFVFDQLRHCDVLDFINVQCEVDAPDYIRVSHAVYEDIAKREVFDILKSTRHYGGMMFYYVTNEKTNNIFSYFVRNGQIDDAADIIRLHSLVNSVPSPPSNLPNQEFVRKYIHSSGFGHLLEYLHDKEKMVTQ